MSSTRKAKDDSSSRKRVKTSDGEVALDATSLEFVDWLRNNGVEWDAERINPLAPVNGGIGVVALQNVDCGDVVARIRKAGSLLSPRTALASDAIMARGLEGGLALTVALWLEREASSEAQSAFGPYLRWLRPHEPVPLCWSADERDEWLRGSDALRLVRRDTRALRDDFVREAWPTYLLHLANLNANSKQNAKPGEPNELFERFVAAATIVASRAFGVDAHHGDALVPFAALFNHSTTQPHVNVQDGGDDEEGEEIDVNEESDNGDATSTDIEHPSHVTHMRIACVRSCAAGEELLNTYGYHLSNRHLLHSFGFCDIRGIDTKAGRNAAIEILQSFNDLFAVRELFPNNTVAIGAEDVRKACKLTEEDRDILASVFIQSGDDGDDNDNEINFDENADGDDNGDEDENNDEDSGEKDGDADDNEDSGEGADGSDNEQLDSDNEIEFQFDDSASGRILLPLFAASEPASSDAPPQDVASLIAAKQPDEEPEEEQEEAPDSFDVRVLLVDGETYTLCVDFKLALLLRVLECNDDERAQLREQGLPAEWLRALNCASLFLDGDDESGDDGDGDDDDDDDDASQSNPTNEAESARLLRHEFVPLARLREFLAPDSLAALRRAVENRLAHYGELSLRDECARLAEALETRSAGEDARQTFGRALRVGERALLETMLGAKELAQ